MTARVGTLLLCAGALGCAESTVPAVLPDALRAGDSALVVEGDSVSLTAWLVTAGGDTIGRARAAWIADDTSIVTIDGRGTVRFGRAGHTRVIALAARLIHEIRVTAAVRYSELADPGCGVTTLGTTYCVAGESTATVIARGLRRWSFSYDYRCALDSAGHALCAGENWAGQLGAGVGARSDTFVVAADGRKFNKISAGWPTTCGLGWDRRVYCWGYPELLGTGDTIARTQAIPIAEGALFRDVTVQSSLACAVRDDGTVACWGSNFNGELGVSPGTLSHSRIPVTVPGVAEALEVSVAWNFACAKTRSGQILCWGSNDTGQLGRDCVSPCTAGLVAGLPTVRAISVAGASVGHACALATSGIVYCWGSNARGALGDGSSSSMRIAPAPVASGGSFVALSYLSDHSGLSEASCALRLDGLQFCWGDSWGSVPRKVPFQP